MHWTEALAALDAAGQRRRPRTLESKPGPEVQIDGSRRLLFCSNDYLGLASDPRVAALAGAAAESYGSGAGSSRLVSGTTVLHRELEQRLAAHEGREDAVVFTSGYLANVGTIAAIVGRGDAIASDRFNHASIIDGVRLSGAQRILYEHLGLPDFRGAGVRRLVVTDSVFSMDGDLAHTEDLAKSAREQDALLMVDDAHATAVLEGHREADILMGTLSKALGSQGGFVAGNHDLIEYLRNRARTFIFDTALAPASAGAALAALSIAQEEPWRAERVRQHAKRIAAAARGFGLAAAEPAAAIVSVVVGGSAETMALAERLFERGVFIAGIRPPSVPEGTARLRITPMATHTDAHVDEMLAALQVSV